MVITDRYDPLHDKQKVIIIIGDKEAGTHKTTTVKNILKHNSLSCRC